MALRAVVAFPPVADQPDPPTHRRFTYSVDSGEAVVTDVAIDAPSFNVEPLNHGQSLFVSLVDVDAANNASNPSERTVTIEDTIPPEQPGELAVSVEQI